MPLPLPALTFYRMADVFPAANTMAAYLDALFAACSATVDYRGTSLASTHRWTWARYQNAGTTEAVYASAAPAGTTMTQVPQLIWCGTAAGPTYTGASPDGNTPGANQCSVGINKNGGAYAGYTAALPFTSGQFFGYWRYAASAYNATTTRLRVFISQETVFVQSIQNTATNQAWCYVGAVGEPYTNDTTVDAESDNRLYGICTSGAQNVGNSWYNQASNMFAWANFAGDFHCGVFTPGGSSRITIGKEKIGATGPSASTLQTASGAYVGDVMQMARDSSGGNTPNGFRQCTLRGINYAGLVVSGRYLRSGSTDLFHFVSQDTANPAPGIMLPAAA